MLQLHRKLKSEVIIFHSSIFLTHQHLLFNSMNHSDKNKCLYCISCILEDFIFLIVILSLKSMYCMPFILSLHQSSSPLSNAGEEGLGLLTYSSGKFYRALLHWQAHHGIKCIIKVSSEFLYLIWCGLYLKIPCCIH